jgi:hypothetical protein
MAKHSDYRKHLGNLAGCPSQAHDSDKLLGDLRPSKPCRKDDRSLL